MFRKVDTLRVGSMCSGWGVLEMVLGRLQEEWNKQPVGTGDFKARCFNHTQRVHNTDCHL